MPFLAVFKNMITNFQWITKWLPIMEIHMYSSEIHT